MVFQALLRTVATLAIPGFAGVCLLIPMLRISFTPFPAITPTWSPSSELGVLGLDHGEETVLILCELRGEGEATPTLSELGGDNGKS